MVRPHSVYFVFVFHPEPGRHSGKIWGGYGHQQVSLPNTGNRIDNDLVNEIFQMGLRLVSYSSYPDHRCFLPSPVLSEHVYHKPYTGYIQIFAIGILFFCVERSY